MLIEQNETGEWRVDGVARASGWQPHLKPLVVLSVQRMLSKGARMVVEDLVRAIESVVEEDRKQAMGEALPAAASADTEPPTAIPAPACPMSALLDGDHDPTCELCQADVRRRERSAGGHEEVP